MDHIWSLATIMPSKIGSGGERMPLRCGPFQWPWWGVEVVHAALPDAACPKLHWNPLDTAIQQVLAPYRPGGCQGGNQLNDYETCIHFAGRFNDHHMRRYRGHCPMEEVCGFR